MKFDAEISILEPLNLISSVHLWLYFRKYNWTFKIIRWVGTPTFRGS